MKAEQMSENGHPTAVTWQGKELGVSNWGKVDAMAREWLQLS